MASSRNKKGRGGMGGRAPDTRAVEQRERALAGRRTHDRTPSDFNNLVREYDYEIPESFIAQNPAHPRDSAKLLVYDRKTNTTSIDTFKNLVKYLPQNSVLVFNKTKVIPARIITAKPTGGLVDLLFIRHTDSELIFWANKKVEEGTILTAKGYTFTISKKIQKEYIVRPSFPISEYIEVFKKIGVTPLPPYIKHTTLKEKKLREEYQTVFAEKEGSVAAPTASLHFTKQLIQKIEKAGHKIYFVTLEVNLGTFAPLTQINVLQQKLHEEFYEIDKETAIALNKEKQNGAEIIAVGTTVVRTLESAANENGELRKVTGTTDLFISENTKIKFVDHVITNFHVPKSSLLMLVASFIGRLKLFELYKIAQEKNFRFFSFGDGMFIK